MFDFGFVKICSWGGRLSRIFTYGIVSPLFGHPEDIQGGEFHSHYFQDSYSTKFT